MVVPEEDESEYEELKTEKYLSESEKSFEFSPNNATPETKLSKPHN